MKVISNDQLIQINAGSYAFWDGFCAGASVVGVIGLWTPMAPAAGVILTGCAAYGAYRVLS